jgi:hypothetical protein
MGAAGAADAVLPGAGAELLADDDGPPLPQALASAASAQAPARTRR